jgi:hypothetical protein
LPPALFGEHLAVPIQIRLHLSLKAEGVKHPGPATRAYSPRQIFIIYDSP